MKKALLLLLIFMLSLALLAACGQPAEEGEGEPEAAETETAAAAETARVSAINGNWIIMALIFGFLIAFRSRMSAAGVR